MKIGRRMQENDALTMVLGFQNVSKSWDDSWQLHIPSTYQWSSNRTDAPKSQLAGRSFLRFAERIAARNAGLPPTRPGAPPLAQSSRSGLNEEWARELFGQVSKLISKILWWKFAPTKTSRPMNIKIHIEYVWIRMLIFVLWRFLFFWRPWSEFWSFTILSLYPETGNSSLPVLLAAVGASATLTDP